MDFSPVEDSNFLNSNTRSLTNDAHFAGRTNEEVLLLDSGVTSAASNASSNCSDMIALSKSHESIEGSPDVDKSEEDGDNDDMLGDDMEACLKEV
ncbi:hypothetical protein K2173_006159 [Erythroxylum novogranatense]|uniref:Uncharacterized protein n=1 Tax=Erythroxylum novogranatense TaxID=1862640 RepID=A0AAV8TDZ6_9ROSI|nr:hypothetical protein K2173_006159 [Erythroxylum novogranatense]